MKEVGTHTCRSCTFQMQKMRHNPIEKLLRFASKKPKKDFLFCSIGFSGFTVACLPILLSLFDEKDQRKKQTLNVPLLSMFFQSLPLLRFSFIFSALFLLFFTLFRLSLFLPPLGH